VVAPELCTPRGLGKPVEESIPLGFTAQ
jgi:hypothetical protein